MSDKITKLQRWLDLIVYLLGRRYPVTVDQIMDGVPAYAEKWRTEDAKDKASARRAFERDKDELRDFGIPIESIRYDVKGGEVIDGYQLARRDFYLPYLKLVSDAMPEPPRRTASSTVAEIEIAPEDARAALDALRRVAQVPSFPFAREARSAFRKLAFDIDPAHYAEAPILYAERPGAAEVAEKVKVLSEALLTRKRVRFRYHGIYRGAATDRDVAAYGLAFARGNWYLVGHDALRDALRVFRVARMETPQVNAKSPNTPDYNIPRDFRLEDHVGKEPWELGESEDDALRADVLFEFPSSLWAARNKKGELVEEREDGSAVRAFENIQQVDPFLRWVLSFIGEAKILSPPELAKELRDLACAVAALHEGPPSETWGGAEARDA